MRGSLLTVALVLAALATTWAWAGDPGPTLRPPTSVRFLPDDLPYTFGNTAAAPDASLSWDTSDASDHRLSLVVPAAACVIVEADADLDRGLSCATPTVLVCSADEADLDDCGGLRYDAADQDLDLFSSSGDVTMDSASGVIRVLDVADALAFTFGATDTTRSEIWQQASGGTGYVLGVHSGLDQVTLALRRTADGGQSGHHVVVTDYDYRQLDHGIAEPTDPLLCVHSNADPTAAGAGEDICLQFVAADDAGYLSTRAGPLRLAPTVASVRLPRIDVAVPAEPHVCDANGFGAVVVVNDNDDAAAAQVCICTKTDDVPTYDWWNLAAGVACTLI